MPLIYVHGVAVRDENAWKSREPFLRHYITPLLSQNDPDKVKILPVFWGVDGVKFAWDGESRPLTALLGQGGVNDQTAAQRAVLLASLGDSLGNLPVPSVSELESELLAAGPTNPTATAPSQRLYALSDEQRSDLLVMMIQQQAFNDPNLPRMLIAADKVAHDQISIDKLKNCSTADDEAREVQKLIEAEYSQMSSLMGMGAGWFPDLIDKLSELLGRATQTPGLVVSRLLGELRPKLNSFITLFIGDIFEYLAHRLAKPTGEPQSPTLLSELVQSQTQQPITVLPIVHTESLQPGAIPRELLSALRQARALQLMAKSEGRDEPIVVVTHSMGGQIVYDTVTTFLPQLPDYQDIRIDFWCAVASQVGLFEEMKLFLASDPQYSKANHNKVPFPDRRYLGGWWNVWDVNDILSFTAKPIIEGVDDEFYDSGSSVLNAHEGYFERPSFYRKLADKLIEARDKNWYIIQ